MGVTTVMKLNILALLSFAVFIISCGTNEYSAAEDMRGKYRSFDEFMNVDKSYNLILAPQNIEYAPSENIVTFESKEELLIQPGKYLVEGSFESLEEMKSIIKESTCGDHSFYPTSTEILAVKKKGITNAIEVETAIVCRMKFVFVDKDKLGYAGIDMSFIKK